ncbi:MAG TPA: Gfo/Idh/MocA family oxidoreductase [Firmicutes bacterium]|nr:Gfo/Idh/MocA family oxidoreductase [Bacillota bacterium]
MINVGVLGAGTMGWAHATSYARLPNVRLVGIADIDLPKAKRLAEATGSTAVPRAEDLIGRSDIDLIDVCLPTHLHRTYVEAAAAAKKHIFCEKPLARSLADGQAILAACDRAGVKLGVGHVVRFFPEYAQATAAVRAGRLGEIGVIRTSRGGGGFPTAWNDWYANYEWSGGLALDLLIHDFDWLRWTFGPVERVFAKSTHGRDFNREEYVLVTLRLKSGAIAHVEGTWLQAGGFATSFEIVGTKGMLSHSSREVTPLVVVTPPTPGAPGVAVPESAGESPYFKEIQAFVNALERGEPIPVDGKEGYEALKIALAVLESMETGRVVRVEGE